MFKDYPILATKSRLLAGVLASSISISLAAAQAPAQPSATAPSPARAANTAAGAPYRYPLNRAPRREGLYYGLVWGIDSLSAKVVESGEIVRFSYRIMDPDKAKQLNDKKSEPSLEDPQAGVKLVVPSLEQVGQLRQSSTPIAGKVYWMAFSNSGRRVKRGDRINIVIGQFRANGLVVE